MVTRFSNCASSARVQLLIAVVLTIAGLAAGADKPGSTEVTPLPPKEYQYALGVRFDQDGTFAREASLNADDPKEAGHPVKLFLAVLEEGKSYRFEMASKDFDPHLRLLTPFGEFVASQTGGGKPTVEFRYRPARSGLFRIQATSLNKEAKGAFSLAIGPDKEPIPQIELKDQAVETGKAFEPVEHTFDNGARAFTFLTAKDGNYVDSLWSANGKVLFVLEREGTLRRVNVETWTEEARLDIGSRCHNLAVSALGLLVSVAGEQSVYLVDPDKLKTKKKYGVGSMLRVTSAPSLKFAMVSAHPKSYQDGLDDVALGVADATLTVLNLEKPEYRREEKGERCRGLVISPNGRHVHAQDSDGWLLHSILVDSGTSLYPQAYAGMGGVVVGLPTFCSDEKYVCYSDGNTLKVSRNDIGEDSNVRIEQASPLRAVLFNYDARELYLHDETHQLIVVPTSGRHRRGLSFAAKGLNNEPRSFSLQPGSRRVLVRFDDRFTLVDLDKLAAPENDEAVAGLEGRNVFRGLMNGLGSFGHSGYITVFDALPGGGHGRIHFVRLEGGRKYSFGLGGMGAHRNLQCQILEPDETTLLKEVKLDDRSDSIITELTAKTTGVHKVVVSVKVERHSAMCSVSLGQHVGVVPVEERTPPTVPPRPRVGGKAFKTEELKLPEPLKGTSIATAQSKGYRPPSRIVWSADAKTIHYIDGYGTLRRVNTETWALERELVIRSDWSARSAFLTTEGLVVHYDSYRLGNELWLLDPDTLEVKKQFDMPECAGLAGSPKSSLVVVGAPAYTNRANYYPERGNVHVLDLKRWDFVPQRADMRKHELAGPVVTLEGGHVFLWKANDVYSHYLLEDGQLSPVNEFLVRSQARRKLCLSPAGEYMSLPSLKGNVLDTKRDQPLPSTTTYVFAPREKEASKPILALKGTPQAVGFDVARKFVLAHDDENQLIVYGMDGTRKASASLLPALPETRKPTESEIADRRPVEFAVHPEGGKVVVVFQDRMVFVDYSRLPTGE